MELLPEVRKRIKNNFLLVDKNEMGCLAVKHGMSYGKFVSALYQMGINWATRGSKAHRQRRAAERLSAAVVAGDAPETVCEMTYHSKPVFPKNAAEVMRITWDKTNARLNPFIFYNKGTKEILGVYKSRSQGNIDMGYESKYKAEDHSSSYVFCEPLAAAQDRITHGEPLTGWGEQPHKSGSRTKGFVRVYDKTDGAFLGEYPTQKAASLALGLSSAYVSHIVTGSRQSRKYRFELIGGGIENA